MPVTMRSSTTCSCLLIAAASVVQSHSDSYASYWDPDGVHDEEGAKSWWNSYSSHPHVADAMYLEDGAVSYSGSYTSHDEWADDEFSSLPEAEHVGYGSNTIYEADGAADAWGSIGNAAVSYLETGSSFDSFLQPEGSIVMQEEVTSQSAATKRASNFKRDAGLIFGASLVAVVVVAAIIKRRYISRFAPDDPRLLGEWVIPMAGGAASPLHGDSTGLREASFV